jgi:two-component system catabolic regulation response regulator CreB/two-component system response regulator ChvI
MINDSNHIANSHSSTNCNSLQKSQSITSEKLSSFAKRILIVDDDPDITFTFKKGLEAENEKNGSNKVFFKVNSYNDPLLALSEFKPDLYDLILIDINMPQMNGIELSNKILELDANVKICLVTAGEANIEVLRELYPTRSIGCFIKKPVTIENLVRRMKEELE